jgi:serine/threonine-protein kinase HipA
MSKADQLNVWHDNTLVGVLWRDAVGGLGFEYTDHWLEHGFALSQQLPLSMKQYSPSGHKAQLFFANLLPEAGARMHIVRDLKIADSDFELLKSIGGECAGALSLLPVDKQPGNLKKYKLLQGTDLKEILLHKGPLGGLYPKNHRPRLSLAGAQDKCPVLFRDGQYLLPENEAPSTHILKFDIAGYKNIPAYEYFMTALAKTLNLPVVECEFQQYDSISFLMVKRYDRIIEADGSIRRLHQEDFCQALGIGYERKYQKEGGPSFYDCYRRIQDLSSQPIIDTQNLLKWQMFNFLAGNSDGHAKNIALLYAQNGQITLAPFYDLVCTRAIQRIDPDLAFSIGGVFDPGFVLTPQWRLLAKECNIREKFLMKLLQHSAEILLAQLSIQKEKFEDIYGSYPALQQVQSVVHKQCSKILQQLA